MKKARIHPTKDEEIRQLRDKVMKLEEEKRQKDELMRKALRIDGK